MRFSVSIIVFTLFFSVLAVFLSWSQLHHEESDFAETQRSRLFSDRDWRNPAAIRKNFDFSRLTGSALLKAGGKRLLKDIKMIWKGSELGIELGHFVVMGDDGSKTFACEYYDRVQFEFTGKGMAENGHLPKLTVDGKCEVSKNINRMVPIWLPVGELRAYQPHEFQSHFFEQQNVHVNIENVSYQWPKNWNLNYLRVYNEVKSDREMIIEQKSISDLLPKSFVLSW